MVQTEQQYISIHQVDRQTDRQIDRFKDKQTKKTII